MLVLNNIYRVLFKVIAPKDSKCPGGALCPILLYVQRIAHILTWWNHHTSKCLDNPIDEFGMLSEHFHIHDACINPTLIQWGRKTSTRHTLNAKHRFYQINRNTQQFGINWDGKQGI